MIHYTHGGIHYFLKIFQMRGSVFPSAVILALPAAVIAGILRYMMTEIDAFQWLDGFGNTGNTRDTQAWSGFNFLVGFLVVFRTSQAYTRFWDGCKSTHMMRAEWFDACSALIAFMRFSKEDTAKVMEAKNILVRLFSMLHAAALAELEEVMSPEDFDVDSVRAFTFKLIDVGGIDDHSLRTLKRSPFKVELIFEWIQNYIVECIGSGVLSIPPPILSRAFQESANGMVAFHDALKITAIPFPFPYAQTCDCLLFFHLLVAPIVTAQWVQQPAWAALFVFVQVFILWSLNFIAVEIENPFGTDANDLDGEGMQEEMNTQLLMLLDPNTHRLPTLSGRASWSIDPDAPCPAKCEASFQTVWSELGSEEPVVPTSREVHHTRAEHHIHDDRRRKSIRRSQSFRQGNSFVTSSVSTSKSSMGWLGNSRGNEEFRRHTKGDPGPGPVPDKSGTLQSLHGDASNHASPGNHIGLAPAHGGVWGTLGPLPETSTELRDSSRNTSVADIEAARATSMRSSRPSQSGEGRRSGHTPMPPGCLQGQAVPETSGSSSEPPIPASTPELLIIEGSDTGGDGMKASDLMEEQFSETSRHSEQALYGAGRGRLLSPPPPCN